MVSHNRIHGFWFISSKLEPPADYSGRRSKKNLRKGHGTGDSRDPLPSWEVSASPRMTPPSAYQSPPSLDAIRLQALLNERLWSLNRERRGLWSKIWRYLWGDRRMG